VIAVIQFVFVVLICYPPSYKGRGAPEVLISLGHPISGGHKYGDLSSRFGVGREANKPLSVKYYVTRNLKKNRKQNPSIWILPQRRRRRRTRTRRMRMRRRRRLQCGDYL